jgi:Trm5-related predicted tRNA methylase
LFLEIERNPTLDLFQRRIIEPLIHLRDYDFDPHLSLVYSDQEATGRSIKDIPINRNIRFGSLAVVQISNNIDEWNIISEFKFNFSG